MEQKPLPPPMTTAEQIAMEEYRTAPSTLVGGMFQIRDRNDNCIGVIRDLSDAETMTRHLNDAYARGQQDRWVSVADRLPEELPDGTNVLGWNSVRMEPVLATLRGGLPFDVWNEGWDHKNEITHWVELPSPPNPEQR